MKKILLILILALFTMPVYAEDAYDVEIPVKITGGGTVRIEGSAFMPSQTEIQVQDEGVFKLSFDTPTPETTYSYKLRQVPGTDPDIIYDDKVYDVKVQFMFNSDRTKIYPVVIITRDQADQKPDVATWENKRVTEDPTKPSDTTKPGDPTKPDDPTKQSDPTKPDNPTKQSDPDKNRKTAKTADASQPMAVGGIFLMAALALFLIRRKGGIR